MRGQTTIDYLTGISLFILTVGIAFTLVPSITSTFVGGHDAGPLVADRAADQLAMDVLARPEQPNEVTETQVDSFFDNTPAKAREQLSLDDNIGLNVTLTNDGERWSVGPVPPESRDSAFTAWRVVSVDGVRSDLRVVVW